MKNVKLVKEIALQVNQKYLNNDLSVYTADIHPDGSFMLAANIEEAQFLILNYSRNKALIYMEPGDSLYLNCRADQFQYSFEFSGSAGDNNILLYEYLKENPAELDIFKMVQYRYGSFRYRNNPMMDQWMLNNDRTAFSNKMKMRREAAQALVKFKSADLNHLSPAFQNFIQQEIQFDYAYHMMMYGHIFKNKYQLSSDFFDFLKEVNIDEAIPNNYWSRQFLLAYVNHLYENGDKSQTPYISQYELASLHLSAKAAAFVQSEMLTRAFRSKLMDDIMPKYEHFSRTNPYIQYDDKVVAIYQEAMKYAIGSPAPSFSLSDINNQNVALSQFRGQVVYLNFWASWCRPCMKKLAELKTVQTELEQQGITFVHVSLDRDPVIWTNTIRNYKIKGTHILAAGSSGQRLVNDYNVRVLPQAFIINKEGNFAEKPPVFHPENLRSSLLQLNKLNTN